MCGFCGIFFSAFFLMLRGFAGLKLETSEIHLDLSDFERKENLLCVILVIALKFFLLPQFIEGSIHISTAFNIQLKVIEGGQLH